MKIYIEYAIMDNLIINYLLLKITDYTLKLNAKKVMILLSSVLGTIVSIFLPLLTINTYILFLIKIMLGILMVILIKKPPDLKYFLLTFFLFLTYTFCLGGMCFGLMFLFNVKTSLNGILLFNLEIPVSIFVLLIYFYIVILYKLINYLKERAKINNFYYLVTIKNNLKKINLCGFLDSGNNLKENNKGIIVIGYKSFNKLYPHIQYEKIVIGDLKNCGLKNAKFINVGSVMSKNKMLIFNVDEIQLKKGNKIIILDKPIVGLAKTKFNSDYDCLISLHNL